MRRTLLYLLFLTLAIGGESAVAQTVLRASQVGNGGGRIVGVNHQIVGTLGQPISGFSTQLQSGFWYVANPVAIDTGIDDEISENDDRSIPGTFRLRQNYPNPFNPTTSIGYDLPGQTAVRLEIFDGLGRLVRVFTRPDQPAGTYTIVWDGRDASGILVATGLYVYRLITPTATQTRSMLLIK